MTNANVVNFYKKASMDAISNDECPVCFESLENQGVDEHGFGIACGCANQAPHSNPDAFNKSLNADDNYDL